MAPERPPSTAVVAAVADREGVDETALSERLYDVVDPEALDDLFRDARGRVAFEYLGYVVGVDHEGRVEVRPVEER